jgi:uncharacterized damage-inducible protein DinB
MAIEELFLDASASKLRQSVGRIEVCLGKLTEEQIWARGHENENAVGNLVLHLEGNVRQWILCSLGGESHERDRDAEFAARGGWYSAQLAGRLRVTVEHAAKVILGLGPDELTKIYTIQKYEVSGVEAVLHVVEHFSYHTGQIIFATKFVTGEDLGFYRHLSTLADGDRTP